MAQEGALVAVIEDDALQLTAMRMLLESWGYRTLTAPTPNEMAEAAAADPPDVIVSDFRLPGDMSGIDAVDALRRLTGRAIPAVLQTGDTAASLVEQANARGYTLLHKPYDPNRLRTVIGALLAQAS